MLSSRLPPPQQQHQKHRGSVDSNVDLDDYFATYVPLSNLPTPPAVRMDEDDYDLDDDKNLASSEYSTLEPDLSGPAAYLARLVPSNVARNQPCALTIQGFLYRSSLSIETVALTSCILDALSFRFAHHWRQDCHSRLLAYGNTNSTAAPKRRPDSGCVFTSSITSSSTSSSASSSRRSSVAYVPAQEVVVLAALSIATSVHDDRQWSAVHWTQHVSNDLFSTAEFNVTALSILKDLDYSIHCFTGENVEQAMQAMRRCSLSSPATQLPKKQDSFDLMVDDEDEVEPLTIVTTKLEGQETTGVAVEQHGLMTPEP